MSDNAKIPYVSLIKIDGKPILPPVITPELRKEILKYKQQAIKLEQRLRNCRELKRNLDDLLEAQSNNTRPLSQLTFGDNSHIEALDISDRPKVPRRLKNIHLSKDLIEVTQYNANGLKTICSNVKIIDSKDNTNDELTCDNEESKQNHSTSLIPVERSKIGTDHFRCRSTSEPRKEIRENALEKPSTPPKPRLIRSNSYTLENPSPILLEHLKKASCDRFSNANFNDLASARNWTSLENNHASLESTDFSSINTVFHRELNGKSEIGSSPDKSAKDIDEVKSPTIEVYQTDISVQQITVNTSTLAPNGQSREDKRETFFTKNPFGVLEPDSELLTILKDIPDTYANQIIELLKKQHIEQKQRLERYDNFNETSDKLCLNSEVFTAEFSPENDLKNVGRSLPTNQNISPQELDATSQFRPYSPTKKLNCDNLIDFTSLSEHDLVKQVDGNTSNQSRPNTTESYSNSNRPPSEKLRRSSTFSMSPSQSLYYSITSDSDTLTTRLTPSVNILELNDNNEQTNLEIGVLREKNGYCEALLRHECGNNLSCSRELFPEIDPVTMKALKREWAASIIGAHVRGYLTRRLIKTERVQSLIATVKDVLMCALELHHSDNIDEKDVELHRRLINQLSAALYSFHDIFFELPIPDQMMIIAGDRQRQREKLKRPQSGRSSVRSKSMSSSKSDQSLNSSQSTSKPKLISKPPSVTKA